jgi:hypothetical protein
MKEITLAAVFDENNLIGYAKYRDIIFPTQNFLRLSRNIEMVSDTNYSIGNRWYLEVTTKNKNILIHKYNYLYGFVFEKEMDPTLFRLKIEKLLKNSQDEKI